MTPEGAAIATADANNGTPSITGFFLEHGRLPFVDDPVKPWHYRGWLVPYLMMAEAHPDIAPRYDYVMRTIENGKLLDEPIPQVRFLGEGSSEAAGGMKMFGQMLKSVEDRTGWHRAVDQVSEWLGFGLAVTKNPSELPDGDQEALYRLFDASKWLMAPTDYIGQYMAEQGMNKGGGFFPTPMHVCEMMTRMTFGTGDHRTKTVMDPCVGTGRFLMTASNFSLRLFGQDINYLAVLASKINLAMFAPWFHIPASFFPEDQPPAKVLEPVESLNPLSGAGNGESGPLPGPAAKPKETFSTEIEQPTLFGTE
jgi:hypothetical protein